MTPNYSTTLPARRAHRYAAYFAPAAESAWGRAGSHWLGRDASTGQLLIQPVIDGIDIETQRRLTAAPRRYGWHATLKAPFALAEGVDAMQLRDLASIVCRDFQPFSMPTLKVELIDDFLALVTETPCDAIHEVARACVAGLHPLAAPLSTADIARRRAASLSAEQDALLLRWGYPYVFQEFRFHLSLTGALTDCSESMIAAMKAAATAHFATMGSLRFESVALFTEPNAGADFLLLEHAPLGATSRSK